MSQDEYALFQMLFKDTISKADREKLKLASRSLLSALRVHIQPMPNWTKNTLTQADVKMFILDDLYTSLPRPPFSDAETDSLASRVYDFVCSAAPSAPCSSAQREPPELFAEGIGRFLGIVRGRPGRTPGIRSRGIMVRR